VNVQLYDENILEMDYEKLHGIIEKSDLIIETTDSVESKILVNGLAYHEKPVIYSSVYDSGKGGDILFTLPGLPCYECVFNSIIDEMKHLEKREWDYTTGRPKPMPALLSDIKVIVARTVKIALGILTSNSENSFIEKITEPGCTMLFIGNEKNVFASNKPFQEMWAETTITPECNCQG
jgi:molybdopterin/thiamine biosynthesis adenylyltransferase